jgi:hypothetical protein
MALLIMELIVGHLWEILLSFMDQDDEILLLVGDLQERGETALVQTSPVTGPLLRLQPAYFASEVKDVVAG